MSGTNLDSAAPGSRSVGSMRRFNLSRSVTSDLRIRLPTRVVVDETSSLLGDQERGYQNYTSVSRTPRLMLSRKQSGFFTPKHHAKSSSWGVKLGSAIASSWRKQDGPIEDSVEEMKGSQYTDERVWYDQYTSTDWVHDTIADNLRIQELRNRKDVRGRILALLDGAQGWVLAALVGCISACIAYFVNVTEAAIFDIKEGYCTTGFHISKKNCCLSEEDCPLWTTWGEVLHTAGAKAETVDLLFYCTFVVVFAAAACGLTLLTKTVVQSPFTLPTMDENLAAETPKPREENYDDVAEPLLFRGEARDTSPEVKQPPPMIYYPAAGSGVAEVKVILSGFVVHGYLGFKTLLVKTIGMILAIASGLSLGKEGPFVHIATCVGNICCRLFYKYNHNDAKRREILSASAAAGVAVAFGAPLGGVLFSLEEVSYYFPPKTLFRTFFACIAATLTLKFLNPYGTGKVVLFEVRYTSDWRFFELFVFIFVGMLGGALGAFFIKASQRWAKTFRGIPGVKKHPVFEVVLVAIITGLMQFWNIWTKRPVASLLADLASQCGPNDTSELCPRDLHGIKRILASLFAAFLIKGFLTTITFGIKVPAGIYVPSMVVGGMLGRIIGHIVQYCVLAFPDLFLFNSCPAATGPESCITPGVYALVAAGATMCGVTRLSVTLVVILFELTGSLDHVLPFSLAVLVAKWTADAIEPRSIYDMLTEMNAYPFLDNKATPIFTGELGDITPHIRKQRIIDTSSSPLVPALELRTKLMYLHNIGELDGGLPIVRHGVLVGLIPAPELEFALDKLDNEDDTLCMMGATIPFNPIEAEQGEPSLDPSDLSPYIDTAPVALDAKSSLSLVYQCFVKLGLRYLCVTREGKYAGLLHKKAFVKYVRELEHEARAGNY